MLLSMYSLFSTERQGHVTGVLTLVNCVIHVLIEWLISANCFVSVRAFVFRYGHCCYQVLKWRQLSGYLNKIC